MERDGFRPDSCSYNVIIQGFLQCKDLSKATELIVEMHDRGFCADATTFSLVTDLLCDDHYGPELKKLLGICEGDEHVKLKKMGEKHLADSSKVSDQLTKKKKGATDQMKFVKPSNEEKAPGNTFFHILLFARITSYGEFTISCSLLQKWNQGEP